MQREIIRFISAAILVLLSLAGGEVEAGGMNEKDKIEQIARDYLLQKLPKDSEILQYESVIRERPNVWVITYKPRGKFVTGGAPELYIDKQSLQVIESRWAQ